MLIVVDLRINMETISSSVSVRYGRGSCNRRPRLRPENDIPSDSSSGCTGSPERREAIRADRRGNGIQPHAVFWYIRLDRRWRGRFSHRRSTPAFILYKFPGPSAKVPFLIMSARLYFNHGIAGQEKSTRGRCLGYSLARCG